MDYDIIVSYTIKAKNGAVIDSAWTDSFGLEGRNYQVISREVRQRIEAAFPEAFPERWVKSSEVDPRS